MNLKTNLEVMEEFANNLRKRLSRKLPKDFDNQQLVREVVKSFGGKIIAADDPEYDNIFGMMKINGFRDFVIKLDLYTSPIRDTFETAVKIGKYIMSFDKEIPEKYKIIMANRFAAALTMPKEELIKAREIYSNSVQLIAVHFQIPTEFVKERMSYCY